MTKDLLAPRAVHPDPEILRTLNAKEINTELGGPKTNVRLRRTRSTALAVYPDERGAATASLAFVILAWIASWNLGPYILILTDVCC